MQANKSHTMHRIWQESERAWLTALRLSKEVSPPLKMLHLPLLWELYHRDFQWCLVDWSCQLAIAVHQGRGSLWMVTVENALILSGWRGGEGLPGEPDRQHLQPTLAKVHCICPARKRQKHVVKSGFLIPAQPCRLNSSFETIRIYKLHALKLL